MSTTTKCATKMARLEPTTAYSCAPRQWRASAARRRIFPSYSSLAGGRGVLPRGLEARLVSSRAGCTTAVLAATEGHIICSAGFSMFDDMTTHVVSPITCIFVLFSFTTTLREKCATIQLGRRSASCCAIPLYHSPFTATRKWLHGCFMLFRPTSTVGYKLFWSQQVSIYRWLYSAASSTHCDPALLTIYTYTYGCAFNTTPTKKGTHFA